MKKRQIQLIMVSILVVLAAFWTHGASTTLLEPASGWSPSGPQDRLPTVKLWVGAQELVAEVASKPDQLSTGLMFRTNLGPNEGMLFVMPEPQRVGFYMRNTLIPLSSAYIDAEGVIQEMHDMTPKDETSISSASATIRYVLEVNRGWFETNHISPGALMRISSTDLERPLSEVLIAQGTLAMSTSKPATPNQPDRANRRQPSSFRE
ncbi:MAG: DUF192 domain-containing protein [Methylomonas sp.]